MTKHEISTATASVGKLLVGLELSDSKWVIGLRVDGLDRPSVKTIEPRVEALLKAIGKARAKFGVADDVGVVVCYEAGREGFWIARSLIESGVDCRVIDAASIEVTRRKKQTKTDRIDAAKLVDLLYRRLLGLGSLREVRVPPAEAEDVRHFTRERQELVRERTRLRNKMSSRLRTQGVRARVRCREDLELMRTWSGAPLAAQHKAHLKRILDRLELIDAQLKELSKELQKLLESDCAEARKIKALCSLRGVGEVGATTIVMELGWRGFRNRREIGGFLGLGSCPCDSGNAERDQGISKAGPPELRALLVQLGWQWLRRQGQSQATQWFWNKCGKDKKLKKVAVIGLARKLGIALWRFMEFGEIPAGALLKG